DPNYALAYAGIVDCYLRLATNYLPPDDDTPRWQSTAGSHVEADERLKLRFEWDWKGAERELRRANELKTDYPAAHQWYAALSLSQRLLDKASAPNFSKPWASVRKRRALKRPFPMHIPSLELTPNEEVQ